MLGWAGGCSASGCASAGSGAAAIGVCGGRARCARRSPRSVSSTACATAWNSARSARPIVSERSRNAPPCWCFHMRHGPSSMQRGQPRLHLVEIADRMLVEDDEVRLDALQAPVLLRFERLRARPSGHRRRRERAGSGRSPEMPCGHRLFWPSSLVGEHVGRTPATTRRCRSRAMPAARTAPHRRWRCPCAGAGPGRARAPAPASASRSTDRDR